MRKVYRPRQVGREPAAVPVRRRPRRRRSGRGDRAQRAETCLTRLRTLRRREGLGAGPGAPPAPDQWKNRTSSTALPKTSVIDCAFGSLEVFESFISLVAFENFSGLPQSNAT